MSKNINKIKLVKPFLVIGLMWMFFLTSCDKDFVEVDLPNSLVSGDLVFENDETAIAAATGMYNSMQGNYHFIGGVFSSLSFLAGLTSDEMVHYFNFTEYPGEFYDNEINIDNTYIYNGWATMYNTIYEANSIIEGVETSNSLSEEVKKQVEGEAKFVRAFCYFYLVNLFEDVPLVLSTNYGTNATLSRLSSEEVYLQIVTDLQEAKGLLNLEYLGSKKTRPNKLTASALLARVFLYLNDYDNAENEATSIIDSNKYSIASDVNNVFLTNSTEAIWQLSRIYPDGVPTADGELFIINFFVMHSLNDNLRNSFENGDFRKLNWISSYEDIFFGGGTFYYPFKYKVKRYRDDANYPEQLMMFRLAEQYLIRAEARAKLGDTAGAQEDLNMIRNRAGLDNTTANSQSALLLAIEVERRHELFCEMGHRWLDLKRTGRTDAVLGPIKPNWNAEDVLYPIPESEILKNPNLTQNPGY
ncbi:MAG TPA: RagB/SusD family nutrient uptake outer membrane protein [Flavobacteriaceae bacterium]